MAKPATTTEARVANGALVISFSGEGARVWRADMSALSSAAFELRDDGGKTVFVLRTPGGAEDIFAFADKPSAAEAIEAVTEALFADGAGPSFANAVGEGKSGGLFGRVVKWILVLILGFVCLVLAVSSFMPRPAGDGAGMAGGARGTGVPLPADQVLGK